MDLRHEIPARAFINAQIIQEALKKNLLDAPTKTVLQMPNYQTLQPAGYQYENPAYIVSLLYCLIVVPKEIWSRGECDPLYQVIIKPHLDKFVVIKSNNNWTRNPYYWLIHYLRNSVAHANYSIDKNLNFVFWNMSNQSKTPNWQVAIDANDLMSFLSGAGSMLATGILQDKK